MSLYRPEKVTRPQRLFEEGFALGLKVRKLQNMLEAIDADGNVIDGFSKDDCTAITTDSVRHVLQWNDNADCHLLQARPIKLCFHLNKAKLYSFTPRIRHTHYVPSYD